MAIAFRSVGARLKADIGTDGAGQSVALPPGHAAGDLLLMFVTTDANSAVTASVPGWTKFFENQVAPSTQTPYYAPPRLAIYARYDTGALGSSVPLTFNSSLWPAGSPWVLAFAVAYSGVNQMTAIEQWWWRTTVSTAAAQDHHVLTTTTANDWVLTFRASSAYSSATFTNSVATDVERVDDTAFNELSVALYDSGAGVPAGTQTVRTTTASRTCEYGSVIISLAVQAPAVTGSTSAAPGEADASVTAYTPTVVAQDGPWALCEGGLPEYEFAVDWDDSGSLARPGTVVNDNAYFRIDTDGWNPSNSTVSRLDTPNAFGFPVAHVVPVGGQASGGINSDRSALGTIVPGRTYLAEMWVYSPKGWSDLRPCVDWYDGNGSFITSGLGSGTAVPAGQWTKIQQQLTAPANASAVVTRGRFGGTPSATDDWYVWGLLLIDPTTGAAFSGPDVGEDVTSDIVSDISITYGRDQERQLNPAAIGNASFTLINTDRKYSPENAAGPLFGDIDPARTMQAQVTWSGQTYPLFTGRIDDFNLKVDFSDRTVDLTFLDGLNDLSANPISTPVYVSMRTGALINTVLDAAGWTGGRDIDLGASVVKYWWLDGTDALTAINDLVKSEGPPAIAYVDGSGTFVFRDRHHRLQRQDALTEQAFFHAGALGDCTPTDVPQEALSLARPFVYAHGWKDIINSVSFDVPVRTPSAELTQVWQDTSTYALAMGQSVDLTVSSTDPFVGAVTPVVGTDILTSGPGVLNVVLNRNSGASAKLTLQAVGGPVTVTSTQVRAQLLSVQQTVRVSMQDPGSVSRHGERAYPNDAPWAGVEDARAIATRVLLHYAQRRPTVQIRVVSSDPAHFAQVLTRTISDRVRIVNEEMGLDADFFVERVQHTIQRTGRDGQPPVHAVVLSCEKDLDPAPNPFTFDQRGSGFDQGVWDPLTSDDPVSVFVFDDPVQGRFDTNRYGT